MVLPEDKLLEVCAQPEELGRLYADQVPVPINAQTSDMSPELNEIVFDTLTKPHVEAIMPFTEVTRQYEHC